MGNVMLIGRRSFMEENMVVVLETKSAESSEIGIDPSST